MNTRHAHLISRILVALVTLVFVATSCSSDDEAGDQTSTDSSETSTSTDDETTVTTATTTSSDDTGDGDGDGDDTGDGDGDDSTTTTTGGGANDGELPGEEWDGFAAPGDEFAVMGVAHDDVLNVRSRPDATSDIIATAGPTETGLVATGRARLLPESIWYEVEAGGGVGWVSAAFVGFMGGTDDATAEYLNSGSPGSAETMVDLARAVTAEFASEEPESRIVQSVAPTVGDLGEITYDVIGLGDDSVAGYRLHIFATPDQNGETFTLKSIERTVFCSRGSDGELCV